MGDKMIDVFANTIVAAIIFAFLYFVVCDGSVFYCVVVYLLFTIAVSLDRIASKYESSKQ